MKTFESMNLLAEKSGCPYSKIVHQNRAPDEIRRLHRPNLARARIAHSRDRSTLLICHEEYAVSPELLDDATGQHWDLKEGTDGWTDAVLATGPAEVLVDRLLAPDKSGRIDFYDGDRTVISLDSKEYCRAARAVCSEFALRQAAPIYKARIARVVPVSAASGLKHQAGCMIGISLDNENFDVEERLDATLEFASANFRYARVVVGDAIHRLTLRLRDPGLSEADALGVAIEKGREFREAKRRLFDAHRQECHLDFLQMSDPAYREAHRDRTDRLRLLYRDSPAYRRVVDDFADQFVARQAGVDGTDRAHLLARGYLLEEAAFCGLMVDLGGPPVLVYPGEIKPFQAVSNGEIPDAPEALRKLQLLSLELERQWLPGERPPRVDVARTRPGVGGRRAALQATQGPGSRQ